MAIGARSGGGLAPLAAGVIASTLLLAGCWGSRQSQVPEPLHFLLLTGFPGGNRFIDVDADGVRRRVLDFSEEYVEDYAIGPDGQTVAIVGSPTTSNGFMDLFAFDQRSGKPPAKVAQIPYGSGSSICFSADGASVYVVGGSADGTDVYECPFLGGAPRRLTSLGDVKPTAGITSTSRGDIVFVRWGTGQDLLYYIDGPADSDPKPLFGQTGRQPARLVQGTDAVVIFASFDTSDPWWCRIKSANLDTGEVTTVTHLTWGKGTEPWLASLLPGYLFGAIDDVDRAGNTASQLFRYYAAGGPGEQLFTPEMVFGLAAPGSP
ncbi:MAG: hypothetical protein HZC36_06155 [Armatimonadetes bacterium]|nr:hypothetical protein [Armatimonadota bacterium]